MVAYLYGPVQHDAFFRKYASKKFLKGMLTVHHPPAIRPANLLAASIVLRQWAKKFAPMYLDNVVTNGGDTPQI